MARYHAIPQTVFFRNAGRTTPRISWRIVDVDAGINDRAWPRKCVATANDEATGRRIADMMNGTNLHASHWQAQAEIARANALELEKRWQGCLDVANRNAAEARAEADRLRAQLFDAREQRDEARAEVARPHGFFVNANAECFNEHGNAEFVSDILKRVQKAEAGEVKMRLEAARALTERDELQTKLDKLVGGASPADNEILLALARHINRVCFKS